MSRHLGIWMLCLLIIGGCTRQNTEPKPEPSEKTQSGLFIIPSDSPKLQQIRVEPVKTIEIPSNEVVSPAKLELNPNRVSSVLLPVPGRIKSVPVKLGDPVKSGQPLLELEGPDIDAAISSQLQADSSITQCKSILAKAQADYERARDLFDNNAIAKKEVFGSESILAQSRVALDQAIAIAEQSLRRLQLLDLKPGVFGQQVVVRAPMSGKILQINVAAGEYRNDTNAPLMSIADLSSLWIISSVPESYIRFVRIGENIQIKLLAYPDQLLKARVRRIADTVDPQTRTIKVQSELENPAGQFRPEMYGEVKHTAAAERALVIPASAVIEDKSSLVCVEESPGHFRHVAVRVGRRSGNMVSILSGLNPGDRIVVDGEMLLKN